MPPELAAIPINAGRTFMIHWDLLWWLLPMSVVGGLFRRHALRQTPLQCEINLRRLISAWTDTIGRSISDLRKQAEAWAEAELETLDRMLTGQPDESTAFRDTLGQIDSIV